MPNCFALRRKGETSVVTLESVDRAICHNLGYPYSDTEYTQHWYDIIGFGLAMGQSWGQIIDVCKPRPELGEEGEDDSLYQIACWLASNYDVEAWAMR